MAGHGSTYEPTSGFGKWMDARLPIGRLMHTPVRRLPDAAQPQLPVDLRRHPHLHARSRRSSPASCSPCTISRVPTGAFDCVERIRRDVNFGWLIRNLHAVGASMFFLAAYVHIFRGLYYGSYKAPREVLWIIGVLIFVVMMATAFMGYSLPWGQMSFWAVTVITNLFSSLDSICKGLGTTIVEWLWGGYSVSGRHAQPLLQPALSPALRDRRPGRPAPVGAARRRPEQPHRPRHQDQVGRGADVLRMRRRRTPSACSPSCCSSRGSRSSCRTISATPTTTSRPIRS